MATGKDLDDVILKTSGDVCWGADVTTVFYTTQVPPILQIPCVSVCWTSRRLFAYLVQYKPRENLPTSGDGALWD